MSERKRCLVTGANGLVGSGILAKLVRTHEVHALVRRLPDQRLEGVNYLLIDLAADWPVSQLPGRTDVILHLAQSENFRDFPDKAIEIFNVNTCSTLRLLDYARGAGVKKFIYASSGGIYGTADSGFTEDRPIHSGDVLGFYLGTKFCSEIIAENYTPFFDVDMIRFFFVYGPQQRKSMLIPRLVSNVLNGTPVMLQGQDGLKINPIHVDDAADALLKCMELPGSHKINIGGSEVLSLRAICSTIGEIAGKTPAFQVDERSEPRHIYGDVSKMKRLLGEPKISFAEGVNELVRNA